MVEGDGFEPSKHEAADLQSAPFDHSGTPPLAGESLPLRPLFVKTFLIKKCFTNNHLPSITKVNATCRIHLNKPKFCEAANNSNII